MSAAVKVDTAVLEKIAANLSSNVVAIGLSMAYMIEAGAKQRVPVKTHALQNSIKVSDVKRVPFYCRVGPHMDYAAAVEFGHLTKPFRKSQGVQRFVAARPYLIPAVEAVRSKFESASTWKDVLK
jgi:hypothetical protein